MWRLLDPVLQTLLVMLARRPHSYALEALKAETCCSASQIHGLLAQLNRWHKRAPEKSRLFSFDREGRCFTLDVRAAEFFARQDAPCVPIWQAEQ